MKLTLDTYFAATEERNTDLIMTDSSMLVSDTGRSLLGDSSVLDSKIIETSKENIFIGLASDAEGNRKSLFQYCHTCFVWILFLGRYIHIHYFCFVFKWEGVNSLKPFVQPQSGYWTKSSVSAFSTDMLKRDRTVQVKVVHSCSSHKVPTKNPVIVVVLWCGHFY